MQSINFLLYVETIAQFRNKSITVCETIMQLIEMPYRTYAQVVVEFLITILSAIAIKESCLTEINSIKSKIKSLELGFSAYSILCIILRHALQGHSAQEHTEGYQFQHVFFTLPYN